MLLQDADRLIVGLNHFLLLSCMFAAKTIEDEFGRSDCLACQGALDLLGIENTTRMPGLVWRQSGGRLLEPLSALIVYVSSTHCFVELILEPVVCLPKVGDSNILLVDHLAL